jgi:hypothetical protein
MTAPEITSFRRVSPEWPDGPEFVGRRTLDEFDSQQAFVRTLSR